jgi:AcrR family transcriptional regulator
MDQASDPLGRSRRSPRLSDAETERRMLDTATQMVRETGLQVSFDLLRFEDVITAADVSRSAVYRRWPTKNHFYADLMATLAQATYPGAVIYDRGTIELAVRIPLEHLEWLREPEGRRRLLVEICRQGAFYNFHTIQQSVDWHTYIALHATLLTLPCNELQGQLRAGLEQSQNTLVRRMSELYERLAAILGYQVRPAFPGSGFDELATLGSALIKGLAVSISSEIQRFQADPFGSGEVADWSLAALGFTSLVLAVIEARDDTVWDARQLADARESLEQLLTAEQPALAAEN